MDDPTPDPQPAVAAAAAPAPRTIGERLRAGRERAGLSLPAAAEKLHLDPKVIEALEADRFADLGASVYVRGHLRRYGDFVGESGTELVSLYAARDVRPPPPDLTQVPQAERSSDPRRLLTPLAGLGCAAVLAAVMWWVLVGSKKDRPVAAAAAPAATAAASPVSTGSAPDAAAAAPAPGANHIAVPPAAASVQVAASATPGPAATAAPAAPERREEVPVRPTQLRLDLDSESWIEVYDARGERLFFDVASAGSVQSIEGRAPLRVVLGHAEGVSVQVNGEAREIPAGAADGEGARFVVNRSGTLSRARQQ